MEKTSKKRDTYRLAAKESFLEEKNIMAIIKLFALRYVSKLTLLFPPIKIFIVPHASLKCM